MKTLLLSLSCAALAAFPVSAGLVAHWPLDSNALDATGNGHDGMVIGTVTFGQPGATAKTGTAADFPGSGHIDVPYAPELNPGTQMPDGAESFSVAFWAYPTAAGGGAYRSPFTAREENGTSVNGPIIYNDANGVWSYWAGNNGPSGEWNPLNTIPVVVDQWTHVTITYDAATLTRRMLIDGVEVVSQVLGVSPNAARAMHFGAGSDLGDNFFWDGLLDDIGFWDHALSDEEVQDIMANGIQSGTPSDPMLLTASRVPLELSGVVQTFDLALANGGTANILNVAAATFSGASAAHFSLVSLPGPIAPGGTGILQIRFDPSGAAGDIEAELNITSNSAGSPIKVVALTGFIHDPRFATEAARLSFGTVPPTSGSHTKAFTIRNEGGGQTLEFTEFTPTGPDAAAFTITSAPVTLAPGATGTVEVAFEPLDADGSFVSRLLIMSNDARNPVATVVLHAEVPITGSPLVAWWPLDEDAADATGNGFDGVAMDESTVIFGEAGANAATGSAAAFGGGGHIDVAFDPQLNPTSFTATLWVQAASTSALDYASPLTSRVHTNGADTNGYIIYNAAGGTWSFWTGQGIPGWDPLDSSAVEVGAWSHLAISYDAATDTKTFWVNGESAAVDTTPSAPTQYSPNVGAALHIGSGDDNGLGFPFDGLIDDVGLFRKALSQSEIQTVMTRGVGALGAPVTPAAPFVITSFTRGPGAGQATLAWTSAAGVTYSVERSTNLKDWGSLTPSVTGSGATATFTDPAVPASEPAVYYRVRVAE